MPASALLISLSAARIASLNLCADEYALLLARPGEVVSVTRLAKDRHESPLAERARKIAANRGALEEVVGHRPTAILTMGGRGRSTSLLAARLGIRTVDLPSPTDIEGVERNLRTVATVLGDVRRARPWLDRIARLKASRPRTQRDSIYVSGGGISVGSWSPAIEWMALAGLKQRNLKSGSVTLETMLTDPPAVLLRSDYRAGQMSLGQRWFDHPVVRRSRTRTMRTDGRAWTCAGPLMIGETEWLRALP